MPSLPSPIDDYKAPPDLELSRAVWDAVLGSLGSRLRALEGVSADFDALIALGTSQALDVIATNVEPQLTAMSAAVAALQADVAEAEDVITALISGSVPASAVAETADRIWFTPALATALAGKQAGDPTLSALAAVTVAANKLIYATGADAFAVTDLSELARTLLGAAEPGSMRDTIGAASRSQTVTGGGLASGGGDLSANRTITVPVATQAEAEAGAVDNKAMTPLKAAQQLAALGLLASNANVFKKLVSGSIPSPSGIFGINLSAQIASGFRMFLLEVSNYRPVTDGAGLMMRGSTNGGTSTVSSGYRGGGIAGGNDYTAPTGSGTSTSETAFPIATGLSNGAGNESGAFIILICRPNALMTYWLSAPYWSGGYGQGAMFGSGRLPTANVNAVRFETYNGNIATLDYSLWGVAI